MEKGRIPVGLYRQLIAALSSAQGNLTIVSLDFSVARSLEQVPRMEVPDLPNRVIAPTALAFNCPLVTRRWADSSIGYCDDLVAPTTN